MTEREKFAARFDRKKESGLVDMKFFLREGTTLTEEEFFAQANHIDDQIEAGKGNSHTDLLAIDAELYTNSAHPEIAI